MASIARFFTRSKSREAERLKNELDILKIVNDEFHETIKTLTQQLKESDRALGLAEARIDDLRETINLERKRFDEALAYDREIHTGIRKKVGLVPKEQVSDSENNQPRPVISGRVPWRSAQADLQKASQEQVRKTEEHWREKIKQVEQRDAEHESESEKE